MLDLRAVIIGLCVLAIAAALVFWRGGPLERRVMSCALVCWIGAAIGQVVTGSPAGPIVLGDLAFAACLLVIVLRHHRLWLYGLFAVEAARLVLHALAYGHQLPPSAVYRLTNNVLSTFGLVVLVAVALWRPRVRAAA